MFLNNIFKFGDYDLSKFGTLEHVERPLFAPVHVHTANVTGRDGSIFLSNNLLGLTIKVAFRVVTTDINKSLKYLAKIFYNNGLSALYIRDENIYYNAIVTGDINIVEKKRRSFLLDIEFLVPDGCGYAKSLESVTIDGKHKEALKGDYISYPLFTIDAVKGSYIKDVSSGNAITFVSVAGLVDIDCKNMTVKQGDNLAMDSLALSSRFFHLDPKSGIDIETNRTVILKYRPAFLISNMGVL